MKKLRDMKEKLHQRLKKVGSAHPFFQTQDWKKNGKWFSDWISFKINQAGSVQELKKYEVMINEGLSFEKKYREKIGKLGLFLATITAYLVNPELIPICLAIFLKKYY